MAKQKTILVAPLHWGLGHAARCIPLIYNLLKEGFSVIIASDGDALVLLRKEFPHLEALELPSYHISYPKNGAFFSWHLLLKLPSIQKAISSEQAVVSSWVSTYKIDGILSDNRPGVWHPTIPSVYISHQLEVLSGSTTRLSTKMHRKIIHKFTECWVPDALSKDGLSGRMGHPTSGLNIPLRYLGTLSRMQQKASPKNYDVLCILSGPEPQRTMLEDILTNELQSLQKRILLVQGLPASKKPVRTVGSIRIVPFMNTKELETAINESDLIICRSGYTAMMDLSMLQKKVFFIPTPGQYEQEYLARRADELGWAPYCKQDNFTFEELDRVHQYRGIPNQDDTADYKKLFRLFERE